jgi:hypothetical protein
VTKVKILGVAAVMASLCLWPLGAHAVTSGEINEDFEPLDSDAPPSAQLTVESPAAPDGILPRSV